jgi:anti-sigma B factor antagonist
VAQGDRKNERSWRLSSRQHELTLDVTKHGEASVVAVNGDLDIYTHEQVRQLFKDGDVLAGPHVVLDLSSVGFLDSSGVGAIVVANRVAAGEGATLHLVAEEQRVLKLFALTGVDRTVPVHPSLEDALAAIG